MAPPTMSVSPYWELTFDADGDVDPRERDRLLAGVRASGIHDVILFSHGWNNDRADATRLYSGFFAPIPALAPTARIGYAGVVWPSMRFCDEPIPDLPHTATAAPTRGLDDGTRHALLETFPGRATVVESIARLLEQRPREASELEEFGRLVRELVDAVPPGPQAPFAVDTLAEGVPQDGPEMLTGSTAKACAAFATALAGLDGEGDGDLGVRGFALPHPWDGAKELLRQATYYAMKRRAGTVGERGLGPLVGRLAEAAPGVRVHLVGHSFGGRLVAFALRGLPEGVRTVKSVTLLQGAFSHYAFAAQGVLKGHQNRIDGPLVCCYSRFDQALGTMYPLASRMAGDDRGLVGEVLGAKWGAMGHDGVQSVPDTRAYRLAEVLAPGRLPASGCVNVDAAEVVRRGGAPAGAHSDIVHPELARVVLAAGRIT